MTNWSSSDARNNFPEIVNQVAYKKKRITVSRRGDPLVAIVPVEDLELLLALEDRMDLEDAKEALLEGKKKGMVSWKEVKKDLGL